MKRALGTLTPWETFNQKTQEKLDDLDNLNIADVSDEEFGADVLTGEEAIALE